MPLNQYFSNYTHTPTQDLLENLIIESIQIYGVDTYFIRRSIENTEDILGSDQAGSFTNARSLEMYVKNVEGYEGQGEFLSRFGLNIQDNITFTVARKRWEETFVGETLMRPKEGDLVYFPMTKALFEVTFIEDEEVFYQTGKLMTYDLQCEKFTFSGEQFNTGVQEIDDIATKFSIAKVLDYSAIDGTPIIGETVTGQTSGTTAKLKSFNLSDDTIELIDLSGMFLDDEILLGATSSVNITITEGNSLNINIDNADMFNDNIQSKGDDIFDFSENDPFSEGNY